MTTTSTSAFAPAFPLEDRDWLHRFARYAARGARAEFQAGELESVADLAALRAWRRYDAATGFAFITYARWAVFGAVKRAVAARRPATPILPLAPLHAVRPSTEAVILAKIALDALDDFDRVLLVRYAVAEESLDELAVELATPKTTLWRRLQAAKRRARRAICGR